MPSKLFTLAIVTCLAFGSAVMSLPFVNPGSYDLVERDYTNALDTRMFEMDLEDIHARDEVATHTSAVSASLIPTKTTQVAIPSQQRHRHNHGQGQGRDHGHHGNHEQHTSDHTKPQAATDLDPASAGGAGTEGTLSARQFGNYGRHPATGGRKRMHKGPGLGFMGGTRKTGSTSNEHYPPEPASPTFPITSNLPNE